MLRWAGAVSAADLRAAAAFALLRAAAAYQLSSSPQALRLGHSVITRRETHIFFQTIRSE